MFEVPKHTCRRCLESVEETLPAVLRHAASCRPREYLMESMDEAEDCLDGLSSRRR